MDKGTNELRILILEDVPADAELMEHELRKAGITFSSRRVETREDFIRGLEEVAPDIILADHKLPSFNGLSALEITKEERLDIPFIFVTGSMGEEWAIETLKKGATDYVLKDRLGRLIPAVNRAMREAEEHRERKKAEEALRMERQRLHNVLENMPMMVCLITPDYHIPFANRAFRDRFGESHGKHCYEYCFGKNEPCDFCEANRVLKTEKPHHWELTTPDGGDVIEIYDFPFKDVDGSPMILEVDVDITERKKSEEELRQRVDELERFRSATIQREFRMKELKDRVKELETQLEESVRSNRG
jgi:CheY-like chemotaxis protein